MWESLLCSTKILLQLRWESGSIFQGKCNEKQKVKLYSLSRWYIHIYIYIYIFEVIKIISFIIYNASFYFTYYWALYLRLLTTYNILIYIHYVYICNYENNVPSRLSPQWLCGNSCSLAHDVPNRRSCVQMHELPQNHCGGNPDITSIFRKFLLKLTPHMGKWEV